MKNKKLKIFIILFLTVILILASCVTVYGWTPDWQAMEGQEAAETTSAVYKILGAVINIVSVTGAGIAIVMLIILGIQYTMNSVEKKAEIKKQMHSYVIGAIIIFSASGILKIIQLFATNINNI